MKKAQSFLLVFCLMLVVASCKKADVYDPEKQLQADEQLIKNFIAANNISDVVRHPSGVHYVILEPGQGNVEYFSNTWIEAAYVGKLLSGVEFDSHEALQAPLGNLIIGWHYGIPMIQPGGRIRLLIPSVYGYGPQGRGNIPANAVLDFTVTLKRAGYQL